MTDDTVARARLLFDEGDPGELAEAAATLAGDKAALAELDDLAGFLAACEQATAASTTPPAPIRLVTPWRAVVTAAAACLLAVITTVSHANPTRTTTVVASADDKLNPFTQLDANLADLRRRIQGLDRLDRSSRLAFSHVPTHRRSRPLLDDFFNLDERTTP